MCTIRNHQIVIPIKAGINSTRYVQWKPSASIPTQFFFNLGLPYPPWNEYVFVVEQQLT